jgi:hypothetical protein
MVLSLLGTARLLGRKVAAQSRIEWEGDLIVVKDV